MKNNTLYALALFMIPMEAGADEALEPVDQRALNQMIIDGQATEAFLEAFEAGDELTEFSFATEQGVGANIGEGRKFTRFPRADLNGPTEWANHTPKREGGANATSCIACHNTPLANGSGDVALNAVVDPAHTNDPSRFLERNTLPLFALGIPQRLAEEISQSLFAQRDAAIEQACVSGTAEADLSAKGVSYGRLTVTKSSAEPCIVNIDDRELAGIDPDLIIKPFGWKGNHATIRAFTRGAAHNELGMQAVELVGAEDGDFDGVTNELSVGDMTALVIYMAALERPVSTVELADLGLIEMTGAEQEDIRKGEVHFADVGCASCHTPEMDLDDTTFSEPSMVAGFYDEVFPDGSDPKSRGLTPYTPISFDLAKDQPNNQLELVNGTIRHLGALEMADGVAKARWFTDFKRHDMGAELSDPDDPLGIGAAMFLTRSLAGVGSTGPWLHDGRATTLTEAILAHGGEAAGSRTLFEGLSDEERLELVAFLNSLVIHSTETEEESH